MTLSSSEEEVRCDEGGQKLKLKGASRYCTPPHPYALQDTELFFVNPKQLISMFTELEEQNLSLIQNGQETEEALEEMRQTHRATEQRL